MATLRLAGEPTPEDFPGLAKITLTGEDAPIQTAVKLSISLTENRYAEIRFARESGHTYTLFRAESLAGKWEAFSFSDGSASPGLAVYQDFADPAFQQRFYHLIIDRK